MKLLATTADSSLKELTIKGVSGSILSGLHIDEIIWDDGNSIALQDVDLKIQHYNTVRGRLVAEKVKAGRLTINLENKAGSSESGDITSLPDFGLPLNMNAHLIQLDSLQITQDIRDDEGSRDLLFQIKNIKLKKVTISDGRLRFRKLSGSPIILDKPLEINLVEGNLNMNQPHDLSTGGVIFYKHPQVGELDGKITLAGTLTNYDYSGEIKHQNSVLGNQTINFLGQGDYKRVHLEKVALKSDHGLVEAKGRLLWDPEIRWNFLVQGKDLSTKKFLAEWPATLNTELRYSGSYIDKRLENNIRIVSLAGNLREYDLTVQGDIKEKEGVLTTDDLDIQLGDNHALLNGRANEPFDLKWKIDAKNITQLLPKNLSKLTIAGKIKGNGTLKGRLVKPEIKVNLSANNLVYNEFKQGRDTLYLKGNMGLNRGALQLKNLLLKSGQNELSASGQASEPFNLNWKINANNLRQLSPQLAGSIVGKGKLTGSANKPLVKVKLAANKLAFKDIKQGEATLFLEGDLGIDLAKNSGKNSGSQKAIIQLKNLSAKAGKNTLTVSGRRVSHLILTGMLMRKNFNKSRRYLQVL